MCATYTVFTEQEILEMRQILADISNRIYGGSVATGDVYPNNIAPIFRMENGMLTPIPIKWGFPHWDGKSHPIINARSETAQEKRMFKQSLLERRCVVPSTGFYEWQHISGKSTKQKYLLNQPNSKMLYMAGFANTFKDNSGNLYEAFCILTTAASKSVSEIHNRMPIIITLDEREKWLTDRNYMECVLKRAGAELTITAA